MFGRGLYSEQLRRYLRYFPSKNILVLIFERTINDPARALCRLADFLSVDASRFHDCDDGGRKAHASYRVRFARSYATAYRIARYLRKKDADWVVNIANALGVPRLFGNRGPLPPMDTKIRAELHSRYEADIAALEDVLGEDLSLWRVSRLRLSYEERF